MWASTSVPHGEGNPEHLASGGVLGAVPWAVSFTPALQSGTQYLAVLALGRWSQGPSVTASAHGGLSWQQEVLSPGDDRLPLCPTPSFVVAE